MEKSFAQIRKELNELGYTETLRPECLPLVRRLLGDLIITTDSLRKYMKISQQALEERDTLQLGAEPYKCDNAKLVKECNELHLAFIQFKEEHEKVQRDLRTKILSLENQITDCGIEKQKLVDKLKELQSDFKTPSTTKRGHTNCKFQAQSPKLKSKQEAEQNRQFQLSTAMATADSRIAYLSQEIKKLKEEQLHLLKNNDYLNSQLENRNQEIKRLNTLMEGGRPTKAISRDCCYKNIDNKIGSLQDEINTLKRERNTLQNQLTEALARQHEAMRRALTLAERNKLLEDEMKNIDQIALTVEAQCNDTVKTNIEKVSRLQDRMNESVVTVQTLEREVTKLKVEKAELISELEAVKFEKKNLQMLLETETDDKKRLMDRLNNFTVIEQSLNMEIDRLLRLSGEQKRKIAELESDVIASKVVSSNLASQQIESLRKEKEFYLKEYHKLLEHNKSTPQFEKSSKQVEELMDKIREKELIITTLQDDLKTATTERYALSSRLEAQSREMTDIEVDRYCTKTACKRRARELDVHREEVKHLEKENSALKGRIQALNESSVFNEERMKRAFQEMEEHITKLENERRDLVISQNTNRSNITHLEDECQILKEKLKLAQNEANTHKANYEQLKILHDQSNRALSDTQSQLLRAETELQSLHSKMNLSHRETSGYERDIARLQGDVEVMKSQLNKIDKEKDELLNVVDDKTEQIDKLENQLKEKRHQINALEIENKEIKRRLGKVSDDSSSNELQLRNYKQEINLLQQDLDNERRLKEAVIQENRRLQEDLASVSLDCRDARKELDIAKRQVEDLKTQLQHYVAEVKRTEDLISHKELERAEILDQFKSLSQENNILESTNHTLENEASQSRVQLSVALDHATDLERHVENQEAIIKSYEKQITELTTQVASLEIQLKQDSSMSVRTTTELKQLKDLCVKLDHEKDDLKRTLRDKEDEKSSIERQIDLLSRENRELKRALDKDQDNQTGLERLLNEARQEVIEQRLLNEDLRSEVAKLGINVKELHEKLRSTTQELDLYHEKALEYSQENKQLRRDIANERFSRAREDDNKRYPSL
ncbi:uncharacterized protein Cep135 isoform X4 [Diabrotica undecimpunctata]|uniref:uncharacterized protein Cep135 isoform X4 n=1 Tax=Diabrotica undecimpunctata TaxID=50387 RepID=UPI003B6396F7